MTKMLLKITPPTKNQSKCSEGHFAKVFELAKQNSHFPEKKDTINFLSILTLHPRKISDFCWHRVKWLKINYIKFNARQYFTLSLVKNKTKTQVLQIFFKRELSWLAGHNHRNMFYHCCCFDSHFTSITFCWLPSSPHPTPAFCLNTAPPSLLVATFSVGAGGRR